jgi:hypothetical protein
MNWAVCDSWPVDDQELKAVVEARKELGPAHEQELIDGFVERMSKEIDRRVDERVQLMAPRKPRASVINPATLGISIPIIAIAGGIGGLAGLIAAFTALVVIFLVSEFRR